MSLENILSEILKEGEEEKLNIIREAREKADNIIRDTKEKIEEYKNKEEDKIKKEAEATKERLITSFELEKDKEILTAKKKAIDEVFSKLIEKITSLPKERYLAFLSDLIVEYAQSGEEFLYLSKHDRELIDENFLKNVNEKLIKKGKKGNIKIAKEPVDISGGVILGRENIRINASLELIVEDVREKWEKEVGQILFS